MAKDPKFYIDTMCKVTHCPLSSFEVRSGFDQVDNEYISFDNDLPKSYVHSLNTGGIYI